MVRGAKLLIVAAAIAIVYVRGRSGVAVVTTGDYVAPWVDRPPRRQVGVSDAREILASHFSAVDWLASCGARESRNPPDRCWPSDTECIHEFDVIAETSHAIPVDLRSLRLRSRCSVHAVTGELRCSAAMETRLTVPWWHEPDG